MFKGLIHRPIAVIMTLVAIMILGVAAIRLLPVSLVPDIDVPHITVQVTSPDKSARELNETMVAPLHSQLVQIPNLENITSTAKDGSGIIELTFKYGADADYIFIDVNERVDRAMASWPQGEERPLIARASATDIPAFFVNITLKDESKNRNFLEMSDFVRQVIVRRFEQLSEIAMVDVSGQMFSQLLVIPDMEKLRSLGIDENTLTSAIQNSNIRLGSLSIRDGEYRFDVRFESAILSKQDVEDVYLKINDRVFQIKDLAKVREEPQVMKGMTTSDGKQAVTLAVIKRSDARMAELKHNVDRLMKSLEEDYPDMEFVITRDQTELLDYSINNMVQNLVFGALFACIIIFFFMQDFRSPLLVVVTIPTALVLSFLFFYVFKISINIISLSGLVLGLGMMVDNSIITIDNITQRWQKGESLDVACVKGTQEVFAPMLSSVLTTCAIFIPLIFLNGIAGALFYDEAMAVAITLFSALIVSVLLIPVLYYRIYRKQTCFTPNAFIERLGVNKIDTVYERGLKWFFRHRGVMWSIFGGSLLLIGLLFVKLDKQKLPDMSHTDMLVNIEWNERITPERMDERCVQIISSCADSVEQYSVLAGAQQFVLSHTKEMSLSESLIYVKAASVEELERLEDSISEYLRKEWPESVFSFHTSGNVFEMIFAEQEPQLVACLKRNDGKTADPEQLNELLAEIRAVLPGVDVQPAEWNEYIELIADPERLVMYDVDYSNILSYLRNSMNENEVLRVNKGNVSMPVMIGVGEKEAKDLVQGVYIDSYRGGSVPLELLLKETRNRDLKTITMGAEGEYYPLVLDIEGGKVKQVMDVIRKTVKDGNTFQVDFKGSYFTNRQMIEELCLVLVISILLLFFILAAQFESLLQPFIILSELIIDIFAAMLVLWICGVSLNLMSMIGIVVMCGIVINDSILKVDTINRLRKDGMGLKHAIMEAGGRRLKSILMTSLTTILAIAPFLVRGDMGSDLQYPLSLALIAGMVAGTLVSVFFIPLAYYVIYKNTEKR